MSAIVQVTCLLTEDADGYYDHPPRTWQPIGRYFTKEAGEEFVNSQGNKGYVNHGPAGVTYKTEPVLFTTTLYENAFGLHNHKFVEIEGPALQNFKKSLVANVKSILGEDYTSIVRLNSKLAAELMTDKFTETQAIYCKMFPEQFKEAVLQEENVNLELSGNLKKLNSQLKWAKLELDNAPTKAAQLMETARTKSLEIITTARANYNKVTSTLDAFQKEHPDVQASPDFPYLACNQ